MLAVVTNAAVCSVEHTVTCTSEEVGEEVADHQAG